ncbi:MAG: SCP2 sterol-binding domain-containing protein [Pseudomonadota bacterium]
MTPDWVCGATEIALNRYLRLEPAVLADCAQLEGKVLALHAEGLDWTLFLHPNPQGVQVTTDSAREVDVRVSATPLQLFSEALRETRGESAVAGTLKIEGDAELLQQFRTLLTRVGFDAEELAAKFVGDTAAHRVTELARDLFGWGQKTAGTLSLDTAEYLREETYDLVHREDVERWMNEVDALREATDRAEARIAQLELRA